MSFFKKLSKFSGSFILLFSLLASANCFAHGGGWGHGPGGGYYRGGGYHGGWGYGGGWGAVGWGGPGVIIGVPYDDFYAPPYYPYNNCPIMQQCYPNGDCLQVQQC